MIALESCHNFRDLGGATTTGGRSVVEGVVYRSDALWDLSAHDRAMLRDTLGIRELIDLRSTNEATQSSVGELAAPPLRLHHLPLYDGDSGSADRETLALPLAEKYALLSQIGAAAIADVLRLLATSADPAVFFCSVGKDRTGIVAAVLLGLLGVPREQIVEDYLKSALQLERVLERVARMRGIESMLERLPPEDLHAKAESIEGFLDYLAREHGDATRYVAEIGVSADAVANLKSRLLK